MSSLTVRPGDDCELDVVALGEVMLRLDPGEGRIRTARTFSAWEGGGEYSVARGLRRCFGKRAAIVTALADNEIGRLVEDLMLTGGLDTTYVRWVPYDGIGRSVRNGLNFTERGFGVPAAVGVSDRATTAISQLGPTTSTGTHCSPGVCAGSTPAASSPACPTTRPRSPRPPWRRRNGTGRSSLTTSTIGRPSGRRSVVRPEGRRSTRQLARHVDVMIGNLGQLAAFLDLDDVGPGDGVDDDPSDDDGPVQRAIIERLATAYPNFRVSAATLRSEHSATTNGWGAVGWSRSEGFAAATYRNGLEILDRVGGGDSFASGLTYGLMEFASPRRTRIRGRPWRPGDDNAVRHVDGHAGGGRAAGAWYLGSRRALTASHGAHMSNLEAPLAIKRVLTEFLISDLDAPETT